MRHVPTSPTGIGKRRLFTCARHCLAALLLLTAGETQAAPANDNIANAAVLTGVTDSDTADNTTATQEPGDFAYRTLWWTWTAPASGRVTLDTVNSTAAYLDIKVYFREPGGALSGQAAFASGGYSSDPSLSFPVSQGTTYVIGIGTSSSSSSYVGSVNLGLSLNTADPVGQLTFAHTATMANNSFAQRITLTGDTVNALAYNFSATNEAGEPSTAGYRTYWWKYRPSTTGRLTISAQGSTVAYQNLAVYLGESLGALRIVAGQSAGYSSVASVTFPVTAGVDYQIAYGIDSSSSSYAGTAIMSLALNTSADVSSLNVPFAATMDNDSFANRITLAGDTVSAIGYNYTATNEASEPATSGSYTLWWTYRPTANGRLTISGQGSSVTYQKVAVYFGTAVNGLKLVSSQSASYYGVANLEIPVTAGQDYQISFGVNSASSSYTGNVVMTLSLNKNADVSSLNIPNPASNSNDNFANRVTLPGNTVSAIGYNLGATREPLEPTATKEKTLWWSWTSGASGSVTVDFVGSYPLDYSLIVSAWTGSDIQSLSNVGLTSSGNTAVKFNATAGQTYHFAVGASSTSYGGHIVMTVYGAPTKPVFSASPQSQIVALGDTVSLAGTASGTGNTSFQWFKNKVAISGATANTYGFSSAALTHAASYMVKATNVVGFTESATANVGVVNTANSSLIVNEGGTMVLTASAAAPGIKYRWRLNGSDLADIKVGTRIISGAGTAKLTITRFTSTDVGAYTCMISMDDPQNPGVPVTRPTGSFNASIRLVPVVNDADPFSWLVSSTVTDQVSAQNSPTKFTITNLPAGVTYNSLTGQLLGKPSAPVAAGKKFTVVASNLAGNGPPKYLDYSVAALAPTQIGSFTGPVSRNTGLNANLGGSFSPIIATSGVITGTLRLGALTYNLSGRLDSSAMGNPTASILVKRVFPYSNLTINFTVDTANQALTGGTITDGINHASFTGWRKKWGTVMTQPEKDDLNRYLGRYTFALKAPAGQPTRPQGSGWGSFTVAPLTGALTASGRLADHTLFTSSTFAGPNGEILVYQPLYSNRGSIVGTLDMAQGSAGFTPPYGDNTLSGTVSWLRPDISGRLYPAGFGPYDLTAVGGRYVAPTPASTIVMGIIDDLSSNNASLTFTGADIAAVSPNMTFRLKAASLLVPPAAANNPAGTGLVITGSSGYFTSSFKLTEANAIVTTAVRPSTYYGQIVRDTGGVMRGYGYFLLADLPTIAGQTVNTTLQKSGLVVLQKLP